MWDDKAEHVREGVCDVAAKISLVAALAWTVLPSAGG